MISKPRRWLDVGREWLLPQLVERANPEQYIARANA